MLRDAGVDARARRGARARRSASRSSRRARTGCRSRSGSRRPRRRTGSARRPGRRPRLARCDRVACASISVQGNQKPGPSGASPWKSGAAVDERRDGLSVRARDERAHLGRVVASGRRPSRCASRRSAARRSGRRRSARRGCESVRSSPGRRCRRRRRARRRRRFSRSASAKITLADLPPSSRRHALDRRGGAFHHAAADLGAAGEADLRDVGMLDEPLADDGALRRRRR